MKKYVAYGIGAALVDTEIKVEDSELAQMNVDKGMMTLVDAERQEELLGHLEGHLVKASHASGEVLSKEEAMSHFESTIELLVVLESLLGSK